MKGKTLKPSVVGMCNEGSGSSSSSITIIGSSKLIASNQSLVRIPGL
jgi:hypothetical protein